MVGFASAKMSGFMLIDVEEYLASATTCEELAKKTPDPYSKHVLERSARDLQALKSWCEQSRPRANELPEKVAPQE
jgi:hypothetical protein